MIVAAQQQVQSANQLAVEVQLNHFPGIAMGAGAEHGVVGKGHAEPALPVLCGFHGLCQPGTLASQVIPFFEPGGFQAEGAGVWPLLEIVVVREVDQRVLPGHLQPGLGILFPVMIAQYKINRDAGIQCRAQWGEKATVQ